MGAYIDGSRENLDTMDRCLLSLEQNPSNLEAVEEIFRAAHTLKGMSATMGFEKIAHLTHEMENILDKLRSRKLEVSAGIIDLIFETFDVLRTLVNDSIESTDSNIDLSELSAKLSAAASGDGVPAASAKPASAPPKADGGAKKAAGKSVSVDLSSMGLSELELASLEEAGDDGRHILLLQVTLVADCLLKGPRVFMVLRTLDDLQCDIIKAIPEVKDLENEKFDRSFKMVVITDKAAEQLRDGIESISEIDTVEVTDITSGAGGSAPAVAAPPPPPPPPPQAPAVSAPPQVQRAPQPAAPVQVATPVQVAEYHQPAVQSPPAPPPAAPPIDQKPGEPEEEEKVKEVIELVQLVTFSMAGETYALEIQQVEAIINLVPITRVPKAPPHIDGVINLRGEIVPVINTRRRLRLTEVEKRPNNQIIILSFEEEKVKAGFLVDSVQEVIRLPESAIEPPSRVSEGVDVEYLRGVGKIDNKIIILLNAHRIVFGKLPETTA